MKAWYSEYRSDQWIAGAGRNVKHYISNTLDERDLFDTLTKLMNRKRIEILVFPPTVTDLDIFTIFCNYGEVRTIIDNFKDGKIISRTAYIETIDNTAVSNALDKAFKIKGKYNRISEKNEKSHSLTDILREMAAYRNAE